VCSSDLWGTAIVDFNHDTLPDIAETNGWGIPYNNVPCFLFINQGDMQFEDQAAECGFDEIMQGRGLVNFDYDNDGDQDVAIFSNVHGITLLRNDLSGYGSNYFRAFLDTSKNPEIAPDGIASVVRITTGELTQMRHIDAGSNYLSQSELSAHFGLGAVGTIDEVRIEWTNGTVKVLYNVPANQTMTVVANYQGDANGDDLVNFDDLLEVLMGFGAGSTPQDLDGSGTVDFNDMVYALFHWR